VLHDLSSQKRTEAELRAARAQAQNASAQKADFLARVSHEVRTPLNAILGFAELMMEERFGPVGSERYRAYLRDIHASGTHIIGLVNDLLDLSKIEAGRLDLEPEDLSLNDLVQKVVAQHQPEANRNRVIVRTSLAQRLPLISADLRVLRQVMETLLVNAVRATPAGGQVIVSTALDDFGQAVLRFRDSGPGMTEAEIAIALEPFRDLSDNTVVPGGGVGLPLTKALAEANKATFSMKGTVGVGTLVELAFAPVARHDPDIVLEMSRQR
jgi:signal transduction histidine kinase